MKRIVGGFVLCAAILLFVMASMTLVSATSKLRFLEAKDPLLPLSIRQIFIAMGFVELLVSAFLLMGKNRGLQLLLIVWLALNLFSYRIGLSLVGAPKILSCFGNLTANFMISPKQMDLAELLLFGCFFVGGCFLLVLHKLNSGRRRLESNSANF